MPNKQVHRYKDIRDKIIRGVDTLCDPVRQTISPKGRNVLFEDAEGNVNSTNDGATIAKAIEVKDPIENAIINIVKMSSLKNNAEVGDGTSTALLQSQVLIKEGFKIIDNGKNPMDLKRELSRVSEEIVKRLRKNAIKVETDEQMLQIAMVSSNSDREIAENTVKIVKTAGQDGMIFLEPNMSSNETEIEEELGFLVGEGILTKEFVNNPRSFTAQYSDVAVLLTDKRLYYAEEAESILTTAQELGFKSIVIVARDFVGQTPPVFITNHVKRNINVLCVREPRVTDKNNDALHDLALYLGGRVVTEKEGSLVGKLKKTDFVVAKRVFADGVKTVINTKKTKNPELANRIMAVKKLLKRDKNNEDLKKRLASLTNGTVTIRIGANTPVQGQEKSYRYDDAIRATRAAVKDGLLIGGGVALMNTIDKIKFNDIEIAGLFKKLGQANVRQIAENCGEHPDAILAAVQTANLKEKTWKMGYNALTGKIENLLESGVVDPYMVTEMAVLNSISVAAEILSSDFLIVNDITEDTK